MGLDMYLKQRIEVTDIPKEYKHLDGTMYFQENVMYWRKANMIHYYFERCLDCDIQNCIDYEIHVDKLKELQLIIDKVLKEPSLASELLPTKQGFFWGSYEYDDYYFEDLKETQSFLKELFSREQVNDWFVYYAWW